MTQHNNIYEAINAVMQEVGYVKKERAKAGDVPYTFAGEAALIAAIRPAMVEHGIIVYPSGVTEAKLEREFTTSDKPKGYTHFHATYTFIFQHVHSDTFINVQVEGEGIDYGDKSVSKAATIAYKYALRQTFCIETGDDPDKYGSDNDFGGLKEGNGKRAPSTNAKPKTTPPAPASAPQSSNAGPGKVVRPMTPESLRRWFDEQYEAQDKIGREVPIEADSAKRLAMDFKDTGLSDDERRAFGQMMFGVASFKDLNQGLECVMRDWLKDIKSARLEAQNFLAASQPEPGKAA